MHLSDFIGYFFVFIALIYLFAKKKIDEEIQVLTKEQAFAKPIVTEVSPLTKFYEAEGYHQNYLANHLSQPYIVFNDLPKLSALQKQFPGLYVK